MNTTKNPNIFLSIPIQGIRSNENLYNSIIDIIESNNGKVINQIEVMNPPQEKDVSFFNANIVYETDIDLLRRSNILIAEITNPSLGVGYEIAYAEKLGMPILLLYRADNKNRVSLMILGTTYKNKEIISYKDIKDLEVKLNNELFKKSSSIDFKSKLIQHFAVKQSDYDHTVNWRKDEYILAWFREKAKGRQNCLDLGTGTGLVGLEVKKNNTHVIGIDLSEEMLKIAKQRLDLVLCSDITHLPFMNNQFDCITIRQVLHYIPDEKLCLNETFRVLKNGGILLCAQIATYSVELYNWWKGLKAIVQPLRIRCHLESKLIDEIINAGFSIDQITRYSLKRRDRWSDFLINCTNKEPYKEVETYIKDTPIKVLQDIELSYNSDYISYRQDWVLLICSKK